MLVILGLRDLRDFVRPVAAMSTEVSFISWSMIERQGLRSSGIGDFAINVMRYSSTGTRTKAAAPLVTGTFRKATILF